MKCWVYHTPELVPAGDLPDCAVVVDVLRATTTMAVALSAGATAVQVFADLEELLRVSAQWPAEQRLRVGERGGQVVSGFDMGNSPLDCTPERVKGRRLFMSTTNGTRALARVQAAPCVLTCALVNRQAVVELLQQQQPERVWIVASGWEGAFSLEDTACAGALLMGLGDQATTGNDEAVGALALYQQWQDNLLELLHRASHGQRLLKLGQAADLRFCAQVDCLTTVPRQSAPSVLTAST
ncbi:MAG: 2-phosphosulfolactate phosphatase family protein [Gloeomargarita sp. SKYG116]|nr:2-phosphosulfolactate phosphatase family protein [Gloeomargarita sp. SKYG116]MCS7293529.1 2-phosphosulfolactate phosphatase family protein [Gloeomargarita sp. SKYB120]MDW8179095.1 2-phosphosulfolactate phosphatase family protein [Gloeomargarita sp. SKYBB_i_bin120]MDW8400740.1 2-phosphosulfolactate phosphatase family protein [Gloeomargarita sp. SKYGB_i_bin116]